MDQLYLACVWSNAIWSWKENMFKAHRAPPSEICGTNHWLVWKWGFGANVNMLTWINSEFCSLFFFFSWNKSSIGQGHKPGHEKCWVHSAPCEHQELSLLLSLPHCVKPEIMWRHVTSFAILETVQYISCYWILYRNLISYTGSYGLQN